MAKKMGILRALMYAASAPSQRDPADDFWYEETAVGPVSVAGSLVNEESALRVPSVFACSEVVADPVATLPLIIYRRLPDGGKEASPNHPLTAVLADRPNGWQSAAEWRGQMQWHLGLYRNAYSEIRPGPRGAVDELIPFHPTDVTVERAADRALWYVVNDGFRRRRIHSEDMWHLRIPPFDRYGVVGKSVLDLGRDTIGKAIALQNFAARLFRNGAQSGGIIQRDPNLVEFESEEAEESFLEKFRRARTGLNAHKAAFLPKGMEWKPSAQTNDEAQFIETQRETDLAIARYWNVPPHKMGILDRSTFNNIEQQALEFVVDTMMFWLSIWEQAIRRDLIVARDRFFAEFDVLSLLRGDIKARFEAYSRARNWGWLSVNEIRKREGMNGIGPQGDIYLQPLNMGQAGEFEDKDAQIVTAILAELRKNQAREAEANGDAAPPAGPLPQLVKG